MTEQSTTTQRARILDALLSNPKGATNRELNKISFRYAARIFELRQEGHAIASVYVEKGLWRFVHLGTAAAS